MSEYVIHVEDAKTLYGNTDFPFPLNAYLREKVVRCRDCAYYEPNTYSHFTCELLQFHVETDGYCAWGKWRESC